jgi:hypothetical protein
MTASLKLAVNGTLMRGLALNANLRNVGATFLEATETAPNYRLWSIHDEYPAMLRVATGGRAIAVEVWAVPPAGLGLILMQEPPGLTIGKVELINGEVVLGVLGEPLTVLDQREITDFGGWRAYQAVGQVDPVMPAIATSEFSDIFPFG